MENAILLKRHYTKSFTVGEFDVKVIDTPEVRGNSLRVNLKVVRDGKELELENPFIFVNPPIMSRASGILVNDPENVFKEIIFETLKTVCQH